MGRGVHLLLGFWWPLMVSYPPAGMSAAVCWAEDAQGPPGVGLVPPVPMRGWPWPSAAQNPGDAKEESLPKRKGRYAGTESSGKGIA